MLKVGVSSEGTVVVVKAEILGVAGSCVEAKQVERLEANTLVDM